jgi:hypothetical protein
MHLFPGCRLSGTAVLAVALLASDASAQNGVHVGDIKVYDNRSLSLMLEQLSQQLQSVRVVDQQRLVQALGLTQGSQVRETVRALQVGTLPLPSVQTSEALQEGALQVTERTSDRAAVPAAAPALPTPLSAPASGVNFGQNALDLLAEQIDLTYRIFNLQMLLERSLTDRLWKGEPRLQAVVGLEISIDPPRDARDHSAVVELTLTTTSPPSLVALMPEAKRYNASALSTKTNAFGGAAVAQILTIGYSEQRRGQVFYLFQDVDTIALERLSRPGDSDTDALSFGWSFRPVLGRRSVAPGVRQLFAVLSFPVPDLGTTPPQQVAVKARTYWRKYDQSSLSRCDGSGASAVCGSSMDGDGSSVEGQGRLRSPRPRRQPGRSCRNLRTRVRTGLGRPAGPAIHGQSGPGPDGDGQSSHLPRTGERREGIHTRSGPASRGFALRGPAVNVRFGSPALATAATTSQTRCVRWVCRTQGNRTVCGWEPC